MQGRQLQRHRPDRPQKVADDPVEPFHFLPRHLQELPGLGGQFLVVGPLQQPRQQLQMDVQPVERIAQFMGDAGSQQGQGLDLLGLESLLGGLHRFSDVVQNHRHQRRRPIAFDGIARQVVQRHNVKTQVPMLWIKNLQFAANRRWPASRPRLKEMIPIHIAQKPVDPDPDDIFAQAEQPPRSIIGIGDAQMAVDHHHPLVDGIEDGLEKNLLPGQPLDVALQANAIHPLQLGRQPLMNIAAGHGLSPHSIVFTPAKPPNHKARGFSKTVGAKGNSCFAPILCFFLSVAHFDTPI